jgi:hypothetical protein
VTAEDLDLRLAIGRAALANHVELVAEGELRRSDILTQMRIEADLLTDLLDEVPESKQAKVGVLLDQYSTLMTRLVN